MNTAKNVKQIISSFLVKILTPKATVIENHIYYERYIDLTIKLSKKSRWVPGDKVQFLLSTGELRSYTPYFFSDDLKTFKTLVYDNKLGDGALFLRDLKPKDRFKILGPRSSLDSQQMLKDVIFFADESSVGLAYCLRENIKTFVFECHHVESFKKLVEEKYKLKNCYYFEREKDFKHLQKVLKIILEDYYPEIYLSGQKESSLKIQELLKECGIDASKIKKKLYWGLTTRRSSKKNAANS